jgi:outer membrane protein assembly factor BamB
VPLENIARVGVLAFLALGVGCSKREVPRPADLPRPKLLWSVSGLDVEGFVELPLDPTGTLFLLDADRHAPFAVHAKTGRRLWTAEVDPTMPLAPPSPGARRHFSLFLADEVLVLATHGYVAAYRTEDGKRLWARPKPACTLYDTRGHHLRFICSKDGRSTDRIAEAATGEEVTIVEPDRVDKRTESSYNVFAGEQRMLGRDVVAVAWANGKVEGHSLRAGLPSWRAELPPKSIDDGESGVRMRFVDGVFIWLGGPMIALDESTGRRLWERPFSPGHREAAAVNRRLLAAENMLLLMEGTGVVKLDARSGAVRERYAVPSLPHRRAAYKMLAAGDRVALVEGDIRMQWEWMYTLHAHSEEEYVAAAAAEGYVVAWTAGTPAPVISTRPAGTSAFAMVGVVLLAASADDGKLFAVDLPRR